MEKVNDFIQQSAGLIQRQKLKYMLKWLQLKVTLSKTSVIICIYDFV